MIECCSCSFLRFYGESVSKTIGHCFFLWLYKRCSEPEWRRRHMKLISSSSPLQCHKPELSSLISKKVVHNYLAFISVEKILSGFFLKKGVFLCDMQFDELFLLRLFVHLGGECHGGFFLQNWRLGSCEQLLF